MVCAVRTQYRTLLGFPPSSKYQLNLQYKADFGEGLERMCEVLKEPEERGNNNN